MKKRYDYISNMGKIIISGRSNQPLAQKIYKLTKSKWGKIAISDFFDGEINVVIQENLKNQDVFIIQSTCPPVNKNIIELLLILDAVKRSQAKSLNLIIPYFGYSRKEKMSRPGEPISAKLIANALGMGGISKIIAVDLHSPIIQGFFNIPVVNLSTTELLAREFKKLKVKDLVVVSPDIGGTKRARNFAAILGASVAIIEKHRLINQNDKLKVINLIGNVKNKNILIVDDLISTGSTVAEAIKLLKKEGALKIFVAATHLVVPSEIKKALENLPIQTILTTDSIPIPEKDQFGKLKIISLARTIAQEID